MRPAIIRVIRTRPFDILIVELAHRRRGHQIIERRERQFAIMIIRAAQTNDHVALRLVVTNSLNERRSRRVSASERL